MNEEVANLSDLVALLALFGEGEEEEEDPELKDLCSEVKEKALEAERMVGII